MLFGKELTSFAPLHEVFGVSHCREPVETRSIGLANQIDRCRDAATLTAMDLSQELKTFCARRGPQSTTLLVLS
jgi:hypothetical protein